jgi:hypothetical protein
VLLAWLKDKQARSWPLCSFPHGSAFPDKRATHILALAKWAESLSKAPGSEAPRSSRGTKPGPAGQRGGSPRSQHASVANSSKVLKLGAVNRTG